MDKKTITLVIVVGAVVFSIGIFVGRFIMLTETSVYTPPPTLTPPKPVSTPTSGTPLPDIHQGCFYGPTGFWICNNYQATKTYLEFMIQKGVPKELGTIGIAHTTGNYVLMYGIPREGVQVPFFEIYDPQGDTGHDLGYIDDLERKGITVTYYELVWKA